MLVHGVQIKLSTIATLSSTKQHRRLCDRLAIELLTQYF